MTALRAAAWLLLTAGALWQSAEAKFAKGQVKFGADPHFYSRWHYLTKFAFGVGKGEWKFRFQAMKGGGDDAVYPDPLPNFTRAVLELHTADKIKEVERTEKLCQRKKLTDNTMEIVAPFVEYTDDGWSEWYTGTIEHERAPHMYFFTMSLCNNKSWGLSTAEYNMTVKMKWEFQAFQDSGSHFSNEMEIIPHFTGIFLFVKIAFFVFVVYRCREMRKMVGEVHPVMWALLLAVVGQIASQIFHMSYIVWYADDGESWHKLETVSEMLEMLSQVLLGMLLIYIAFGYTITQSNIDGGLEEVTPFAVVMGMLHVLFVGFAKIQEDGAYRTNKHNSVSGYFLVFFRLVLYWWFIYAVGCTKDETKDPKLKAFLDKFKSGGSWYFLSYIGIHLIGGLCFNAHLQQPIMTGGWMIMQMATNIWLASLFLWKGEYFQLSTLSAILPGGADKSE